MPIFYISFEVEPTERNRDVSDVAGAIAHCWVLEQSATAAVHKAQFYITRYEWGIISSTSPVVVTEESYLEGDARRKLLLKAKQETVALFFRAHARDGLLSRGPVTLEPYARMNLNAFVQGKKRVSAKGRCLHFDSGPECKEAIAAHSIQERGILNAIARDGHVYVISRNIGSLFKNKGELILELRGIGVVSTFPGFCAHHDASLFKPIDSMPLAPTHEQVALYAYRALCRELLTKENALAFMEDQLATQTLDRGARGLLETYRDGTLIALRNLRHYKAVFDTLLRQEQFADVEYTLFRFDHAPTAACSFGHFPVFDFLGNPLRDLSDLGTLPDFLAVCSATMNHGWGLLFAWHKAHFESCRALLSSLATIIHDRASGEDCLFAFVIASCENVAFAPAWWESLNQNQQEEVQAAITITASPFVPLAPTQIAQELEGVHGWTFAGAVDSRRR